VEVADGVIEAAQVRRARAPRDHRCTGSRTTPSAFCDFLIFRELQNEERRFYGKMQKRVDS